MPVREIPSLQGTSSREGTHIFNVGPQTSGVGSQNYVGFNWDLITFFTQNIALIHPNDCWCHQAQKPVGISWGFIPIWFTFILHITPYGSNNSTSVGLIPPSPAALAVSLAHWKLNRKLNDMTQKDGKYQSKNTHSSGGYQGHPEDTKPSFRGRCLEFLWEETGARGTSFQKAVIQVISFGRTFKLQTAVRCRYSPTTPLRAS